MNDILTAISTVGFPIVECVMLYAQNTKMTDALNANTLAITKLAERLNMGDELENA